MTSSDPPTKGGPTGPVTVDVAATSRATLTVLVRGAAGISHQKARALIAAGAVTVDGAVVADPAFRPHTAAHVAIAPPRGSIAAAAKRAIAGPGFRVLHLDRAIVVVDKDAGIVTIPVPDEDPRDPSLVARVGAALTLAGHRARDLWIVHRIDRETSGLVLFARTARVAEHLREQFRTRTPLREYLAWTEGVPEPRQGRLQTRLAEDTTPPRRVRVVAPRDKGRDAELRYDVEAVREHQPPRRARVRVNLVTGRRNQIRVQFAHAGWPIVGDRFYGAADVGPGHTALHAHRLAFVHPATEKRVEFVSPVPEDLRKLDRSLLLPRQRVK